MKQMSETVTGRLLSVTRKLSLCKIPHRLLGQHSLHCNCIIGWLLLETITAVIHGLRGLEPALADGVASPGLDGVLQPDFGLMADGKMSERCRMAKPGIQKASPPVRQQMTGEPMGLKISQQGMVTTLKNRAAHASALACVSIVNGSRDEQCIPR